MPWSPLARGYLTRPHEDVDATLRGETEEHLYEHPYREGAAGWRSTSASPNWPTRRA